MPHCRCNNNITVTVVLKYRQGGQYECRKETNTPLSPLPFRPCTILPRIIDYWLLLLRLELCCTQSSAVRRQSVHSWCSSLTDMQSSSFHNIACFQRTDCRHKLPDWPESAEDISSMQSVPLSARRSESQRSIRLLSPSFHATVVTLRVATTNYR